MIGARMYGTLEIAAAYGVTLRESRRILDQIADILITPGLDAVYGLSDHQQFLHALINPYAVTPDRVEYQYRRRIHAEYLDSVQFLSDLAPDVLESILSSTFLKL